ncbi:MAG TPA: histidine kinase [Actinospica sp.]|nr:histidine kinase [Actinospica sp.]
MRWLTHGADGAELVAPTGAARWVRPSPPIPRPGRRELIFDLALGLVLVVPFKPFVRYTQSLPGYDRVELNTGKGTASAIAVAMLIPLLMRRRFALAALWILLIEAHFFQTPLLNVAVAVAVCAYSAAVYSPHRLIAFASLPLAVLALFAYDYQALIPSNSELATAAIGVALSAGAALYGAEIRRQAQLDVGDQRRRRVEQQQEAIRRAVEDERSRIARELHDIVTHNVSVMVVMAGAARKVLDRSPAQATDALLEVEAAGRAAMGELRQVMGLLTESVRDQHTLAPQPGLDQIGVLVDRIRATGVPIHYRVTGAQRALGPGIDLTAYRVVQEALTNTVKHAAGAGVRISVEYKPVQLVLDIADSGGGPGQSAASGNGRGLIGLRERVALHGGTAEAGPQAGGGYRVRVQIPLPAEDAPTPAVPDARTRAVPAVPDAR